MERRHFLKLVGAGAAAAALAAEGHHLLNSPAAHTAATHGAARPTVSAFIADPPFSFNYGGQSSTALLRRWPSVRTPVRSSPGRYEEHVTWRAPSVDRQRKVTPFSGGPGLGTPRRRRRPRTRRKTKAWGVAHAIPSP